MDKIDLQILTILQKNARTPLKQLAAEVFLSSPATAARIEKLEKDGVISGYSAIIDHKKLGFPIIAFINLDVLPSQKKDFYPFVNNHPNVLECNCVTGHHSMLIKVCFESTENLDTFIGQLQTFGITETQIVFSTAKQQTGVNLKKIEKKEFPSLPKTAKNKKNPPQ